MIKKDYFFNRYLEVSFPNYLTVKNVENFMLIIIVIICGENISEYDEVSLS